jgi:NTE family protein
LLSAAQSKGLAVAKTEQTILVLQGGGALGAYQAGVYDHLGSQGFEPDWVAGISIGAINAAIICGNPVERRCSRLNAFWEEITSGPGTSPWLVGPHARQLYGDIAAATVVAAGVPGFFSPRSFAAFLPFAAHPALSFYDTAPLHRTLLDLVDFDFLNERGSRLSVGAVDIETANFTYFDSRDMRLGPEHIMASGALPPGFPPIEVDGRFYWDGGLVSNTPLQYVMEDLGRDPVCIFQVDVFSARGAMPRTLADVSQREKDIRFSSRTRLTTDRYQELHDMRAAVHRLAAKLPEALQNDPDLALLRASGPACPITLVHLIHRRESFESQAKDYEFSRLSMQAHWDAGFADARHTLDHKLWKARPKALDGLQVFDLSRHAVGVAA